MHQQAHGSRTAASPGYPVLAGANTARPLRPNQHLGCPAGTGRVAGCCTLLLPGSPSLRSTRARAVPPAVTPAECRQHFPLLPRTGSTPPETLGDPATARCPQAWGSAEPQHYPRAGGVGGRRIRRQGLARGEQRRAGGQGRLRLPACCSLPWRAGPGHAGICGSLRSGNCRPFRRVPGHTLVFLCLLIRTANRGGLSL